MIFTRCATRTAMYLLSSVKPRYTGVLTNMPAPSRKITTERDYLRFGNIGGKMHVIDDPADPFLGKWVEYKCKHAEEYYKALGLIKVQIDDLVKMKTWISYSQHDKIWTCKTGYIDSLEVSEYTFLFGQEFPIIVMGMPMKVFLYKHRNIMTEKQTSLVDEDTTISIERKVKGDDMKAFYCHDNRKRRYKWPGNYSFNDVTMVKKFKRVSDMA